MATFGRVEVQAGSGGPEPVPNPELLPDGFGTMSVTQPE